MTKNEKELVVVIQAIMTRKKIEGVATEMYKVEKKSNNHFVAEARIGNSVWASKGKDSKDVIKNLIKEMK